MSTSPVITFKAGRCDADFDTSPPKIKPVITPGVLYLYYEDDLIHLCWRPRTVPISEPELDLIMVPADGTFTPYLGPNKIETENGPKSPINGRIFVLKFSSSSDRHFFWLQSKEQPPGDPSIFSPRDLKLGEIVNNHLSGQGLDSEQLIAAMRRQFPPPPGGDDDDTMEDVESTDHAPEHNRGGSGGAGADATGGDVREEGDASREGGADGGRANNSIQSQTNEAVQNFLNSLQSGQANTRNNRRENPFTTLPELLPSSATIPMIEAADPEFIEELLVSHLPVQLVLLEHQLEDVSERPLEPEMVRMSVQALTREQQKSIVSRVLRSPQFFQGLQSLTSAIRDGGLPSVSEALGIDVENKGYMNANGGAPLGGGDAVEAFLKGIRKAAEEPGRKRT